MIKSSDHHCDHNISSSPAAMRTTSVKTSSEHLTPTIAELSTSGEPVFFFCKNCWKLWQLFFFCKNCWKLWLLLFFSFAKTAENYDNYCESRKAGWFFSHLYPLSRFSSWYWNWGLPIKPLIKSASKLCWLNILICLMPHSKLFLISGSSCWLSTWLPRALQKRSWAGRSVCEFFSVTWISKNLI